MSLHHSSDWWFQPKFFSAVLPWEVHWDPLTEESMQCIGSLHSVCPDEEECKMSRITASHSNQRKHLLPPRSFRFGDWETTNNNMTWGLHVGYTLFNRNSSIRNWFQMPFLVRWSNSFFLWILMRPLSSCLESFVQPAYLCTVSSLRGWSIPETSQRSQAQIRAPEGPRMFAEWIISQLQIKLEDDQWTRKVISVRFEIWRELRGKLMAGPVSYTHLTLPTRSIKCRSRWSPYH